MMLSFKEPCVFPFLLTIRSEKQKQKTKNKKTKSKTKQKTSTVGTFGVK